MNITRNTHTLKAIPAGIAGEVRPILIQADPIRERGSRLDKSTVKTSLSSGLVSHVTIVQRRFSSKSWHIHFNHLFSRFKGHKSRNASVAGDAVPFIHRILCGPEPATFTQRPIRTGGHRL